MLASPASWPAAIERNVADKVLPPHLDWPCLLVAGILGLACTVAGVIGIAGWAPRVAKQPAPEGKGSEEDTAGDPSAATTAGWVVAVSVIIVAIGVAGMVIAAAGGVREVRRFHRFGY